MKKRNSLFCLTNTKNLGNTISLSRQDAVITNLFCVVAWDSNLGKAMEDHVSWPGYKRREKELSIYVNVPDRNVSTVLAIKLEDLKNC